MKKAFLLMFLAACSQEPKVAPVTPAKTQLSDGLQLVVEENHAAPVAAIELWVRAGSADENDAKAGVARLTQRLVLRGEKNHSMEAEVSAFGGHVAGFTSFDHSVFQVSLASRFFESGLQALGDALQHPDFDEVDVKKEIAVQQGELKHDALDPAMTLQSMLFATAFVTHPYRRPLLGTEASLAALGAKDAQNFFKKFYRAGNATLVVTGDVDTSLVKTAVKKYLQLQGGAEKRTPRVVEQPQSAPRAETAAVGTAQSYVAFAWHIPAAGNNDLAALDVLSVVLGQGESARLPMKLKHNLANDTYAFAYIAEDPGIVTAGLSAAPNKAGEAAKALLTEVGHLRSDVVSPSELQRAKRIILNDNLYGRQTVEGSARKLGFFAAISGDASFEERYFKSIDGVTGDDVLRVANQYLTANNMSVVALVPKGDALKADTLAEEAKEQDTQLSEHKPAVLPPPGALGVYRVPLPNGTIVLVQEDHRLPTVSLRATFLGGERLETKATSGIGNLLARVLGRATKKRSANDVQALIDNIGASIQGFSGQNIFGLRGEFLKSSFDQGLELFAELLKQPAFPSETLEQERAVVLEQVRGRDDNPSSVAFDLFLQTLFDNHPFKLKPFGSVESVTALTAEDLANFYHANYPLGRMVISVVGDVHAPQVVAQLQRLFGSGDKAPPAPVVAEDPPLTAPRTAGKERPQSSAAVIIGFRGARVKDIDRYSLDLLATLLSGPQGRLQTVRNLSQRANAFAIEGVEPGYFAIYFTTAPKNVATAQNEVKDRLKELTQKEVPVVELDAARRYLVGTHAMSLESASARAAAMAIGEVYGLGYDDDTRYDNFMNAVTTEDVLRVAKNFFDPLRMVTVVVGPKQ